MSGPIESITKGIGVNPGIAAWCVPLVVIGVVRIVAPAPKASLGAAYVPNASETESIVLPRSPVTTPEQDALAALIEDFQPGAESVASPMISIERRRVEPAKAESGSRQTFAISAILKGATPLAIINGKTVAQGAALPGGWRLERIDEAGLSVVLRGPKGERRELVWRPKQVEGWSRR